MLLDFSSLNFPPLLVTLVKLILRQNTSWVTAKIFIKKNIALTVCLFLCVINMPNQLNAEEHYFDGKKYTVVLTPEAFVDGYKKGDLIMIKITGKNYRIINNKIMQYATKIGLDYSKIYSPVKVIYGRNNEVLSMAESFQLIDSDVKINNMVVLGNNPGAQVIDYKNGIFYIPTVSYTRNITSIDVQNIRKYYKYLASLWWVQHKEDQGEKICDKCYKTVDKGEGYISGYIEGKYLMSSRLYCDNCMDNIINDPSLLKGLKNNPAYMGEGFIDKVREYIRTSHQ
ncbi:MAG: hypothetical protein WCQ47_07790 [bacterium]